ncbi:NAD-dependent epimerase/dehydratase family protein [Roseivirga pacifica]
MKIAIIGGSGFVGSFLIKELEGEQILNIDKNPSPFYQSFTTIGNVLNKKDIILDDSIDTVVLLAAEHRDDISPTSLYYDVNVGGTQNVLEVMDSLGIKNLVFTSSVAIYGLNKDNPTEVHPEDPFNHYGKSKWQAEQVIKEWFDSDPEGKSVTIVRPTVIFGERNRGNVYNLLKQIASKKFMLIGSGTNKKSMAYVGNVVAFIHERISQRELGFHIFNYVDKPDFTMLELIEAIEDRMNITLPKGSVPYSLGMLGGYVFDLIAFLTRKKFSISSVRVKKFCATTQFDAEKVHSGFQAPYTLKEGLNRTLEHEFLQQKKDEVLFYSE